MNEIVTIARVGHRGDGIADTPAGPLYVPYTLPGEVVSVERRGTRADLAAIEQPSPARISPACRHFGTCGGCLLQHWRGDDYAAWKRDLVAATLAEAGLEVAVDPLVPGRPGMRRRLALTAVRAGRGILLGFSERQAHRIVDIAECPIAMPALVAALPGLKTLAADLLGRKDPLRLVVTATAEGLDIAATGARKIDPRTHGEIVGRLLAGDYGRAARLSVEGEVVIAPRQPMVDVDGVMVALPPGGFLQAVAEAETAMAARVIEGIGGARRILDLFAGIGTFSLRLARSGAVHAVDGDAAAIGALAEARRRAADRHPVATEVRDLFRRPFQGKELERFDAVVFDPPFAGAKLQAEMLAVSKVPTIVAVSCNPATLGRDLAILVAGGYRVTRVTPIDQFLWSPHVEVVATLSRPR
ncbi:class I SAM-dependent RNA methyltransferase [Segnochrobactrum spirostomi]|uniref:Class I SAM-dependent RNA methyltransferase n=1 Tax=Segnochrobactrum spirostomi TaxID=2608987 RepID=A0A6A7Y8M8_9HYPH|nr:RsmD family RNA methyltransferase [Segnochrobactrum spirostomi]MQT13839.1 class I SAM-dependent RNA methyltransferase [Segnochrobactrum spirostomi]